MAGNPHLCGHLLSGNQPTTNCANAGFHACVTVYGEAEKVTHTARCRNLLLQRRISPMPSM
jgi:hypothetical protein